jgi:signal transduction histidine kinase
MNQFYSQKNPPIHTDQLRMIEPSHVRRLLEASTVISSSLEQSQILNTAVAAAAELTSSESASIYLVEPDLVHIYLAAATFLETIDSEYVIPVDGSVAGWIVRNGKPLILHDARREVRKFPSLKIGYRALPNDLMAVPFIRNDRVIGVLEVVNKKGHRLYDEQDDTLLRILASQTTVALENSRLFEQSDLIAEFMHELKTPLMALTTASEILAREELPPFHLELLTMIQSETARLTRMAQDFLDLARLEFGRVQLTKEPVDLAALVNDITRLQKAQAAKRQITFVTDIPPELPVVVGDYDQLKQVLLNLTSNAIKYNSVGGTVSINIRPNSRNVVIEIADSGPGIAPEYLPHLFERFFRVKDEDGFTEGTGLGLPIAKRIIENHGGRIEVDSTLGQGSVFSCYLPINSDSSEK